MQKRLGLSFLFVLLLALALASNLPMPVYAIGEVTPTPAPDEPEEDEEIDVEDLLDEGLADLQAGEFRSAIANMDLILEADPSNTTALLIRGVAFTQLGLYEDAVDDFSTALDYAPWQYEFYLFRGDTYRLMREDSDALLDYDAAIAINPLLTDAFIRRSDLNYEMGDEDAGDFDDLMLRGLDALALGDAETAIDLFSDATDSNVDDELRAVAYYDRGIAYLQIQEGEDAIDDFSRALDLYPEFHNAYLARGIQYRVEGDLEAAGDDFFNRLILHEGERVEDDIEIGETIELDMIYRRVIAVSFDGDEGQEITITARDFGSTLTDPLIVLLDPQGNPIAGDDDFGGGLNSEIEGFELPDDGTYTLLVGHAEGGYDFGFTGVIEVSIENE